MQLVANDRAIMRGNKASNKHYVPLTIQKWGVETEQELLNLTSRQWMEFKNK